MALTETRTVLAIVAGEACFSASGSSSASAIQIMAPAVSPRPMGSSGSNRVTKTNAGTARAG